MSLTQEQITVIDKALSDIFEALGENATDILETLLRTKIGTMIDKLISYGIVSHSFDKISSVFLPEGIHIVFDDNNKIRIFIDREQRLIDFPYFGDYENKEELMKSFIKFLLSFASFFTVFDKENPDKDKPTNEDENDDEKKDDEPILFSLHEVLDYITAKQVTQIMKGAGLDYFDNGQIRIIPKDDSISYSLVSMKNEMYIAVASIDRMMMYVEGNFVTPEHRVIMRNALIDLFRKTNYDISTFVPSDKWKEDSNCGCDSKDKDTDPDSTGTYKPKLALLEKYEPDFHDFLEHLVAIELHDLMVLKERTSYRSVKGYVIEIARTDNLMFTSPRSNQYVYHANESLVNVKFLLEFNDDELIEVLDAYYELYNLLK